MAINVQYDIGCCAAGIDSPILTNGTGRALLQAMTHGGFKDLLKSGGFQAFLWTQFLGAFNDNVYQIGRAHV